MENCICLTNSLYKDSANPSTPYQLNKPQRNNKKGKLWESNTKQEH